MNAPCHQQACRPVDSNTQETSAIVSSIASTLLGRSSQMRELRSLIPRVASSRKPVLVTGETGTGKDLVARALHVAGPHPRAPFLVANCGGFSANLIESELFGHEKGAFTGADVRKAGLFEAAGDGTLFLDEIAELPLLLQTRFLRVLETGKYRPLGATTERTFTGRVVCATWADLIERVEAGTFRQDLYYRLQTLELQVPSLDERREDIAELATHFASLQDNQLSFTPEALAVLAALPWPGNVRELRNFVDRLGVFAGAEVDAGEVRKLAARARMGTRRGSMVTPPSSNGCVPISFPIDEILDLPLGDKLAALESMLVEAALRRADGNKSKAAFILGVHRKVVERRVYVMQHPKHGKELAHA